MTETDLVLDLHVGETNDFFRVSNAIEQIESNEHKDIEKMKILYREAKRLFDKLNLDQHHQIKALKWNGTRYIVKDMPEKEVIQEIYNCEERSNIEQMQRNLISLAHHYKIQWNNSKIYVPFFEYCLKLLKRVIGNPRISEIYDDTQRSQELLNHVAKIEDENVELKTDLQNLKDQLEFIKVDLKETLMNEEMFRLMGRVYKDNIQDDKLVRMLMIVQLQKTCTLKDIFKELRFPVDQIKEILSEYPQYFKIDTGVISINSETFEEQMSEEVNDKIKKVDGIIKQENSISQRLKTILENLKNIKKYNKGVE